MCRPGPTLRIAPTPSGYVHPGNALNFVLTAAWAGHLQGRLLLRIDDLDRGRVRQEYLQDLRRQLVCLFGNTGGELWQAAYRQSQHLGDYGRVLSLLREADLVYACTCSRRDVFARQEALGLERSVHRYPGTCRSKGLELDSANAVWRVKLRGSTEHLPQGSQRADKHLPKGGWTTDPHRDWNYDLVVRGRDGQVSYQLASLVDDVQLGVTHLVRGEDLLESTQMQLALARLLRPLWPQVDGFATSQRWHHPLILGADGQKLSKSVLVGTAGPAPCFDKKEVARLAQQLLGQGVPEGVAEVLQEWRQEDLA